MSCTVSIGPLSGLFLPTVDRALTPTSYAWHRFELITRCEVEDRRSVLNKCGCVALSMGPCFLSNKYNWASQ